MTLMHKVISMRSLAIQLFAFGLLFFAQPAAAQDGFADGNFDAQGNTLSGYCYFPASTCPGGVWSGYSGLINTPNSDWQVSAAPSPQTVAFVQNTGNVAQTFTATASKHVRLTWVEADRPVLGGEAYTVKVNGVAIGSYTSSTSSFVTRYSDYFDIVTGSAYTINFQGTSTSGDHSAFIDSVRLTSGNSQTSYAYDALGRLVGAVSGDDSTTTTSIYSFDPASNRQWVNVAQADGTKVPIFRFIAASKYFYTTSYLEGQQAGESSQGAAFYMLSSGGSGRTPLYRCYYAGNGDRFISPQSNCEGVTQEGLMGYVYAAPTSGYVSLYRFYNPTSGTHLITINYSEGSSCCTYEWTLGYVPQ